MKKYRIKAAYSRHYRDVKYSPQIRFLGLWFNLNTNCSLCSAKITIDDNIKIEKEKSTPTEYIDYPYIDYP